MKSRLFLLLVPLFFACNQEPASVATTEEPSLDWLIGDWERVNEMEGKRTYEFWKKDGDLYNGMAYTLRDVDTVFMEAMRIHKILDQWSLEVYGPNEVPTIFTFSLLEDKKFVADCPTNEFPKKITYFASDEKLHAIISDSAMNIPFEFRPLVEL